MLYNPVLWDCITIALRFYNLGNPCSERFLSLPLPVYRIIRIFASMKRMTTILLSCLMLTATAQLPRGIVMIDVSRHFMPLDFLYRQVDELSRYGIPAMQLHLTDAAGWRLEIQSYPQLTDMGAWRTAHKWSDWWQGDRQYSDSLRGYGGYYTQAEMRALVKYAGERGVEIIPEIEFPAHSEEVTAALPWLSCTGQPYTSADLCIGSDSTYVFMSRVLSEVAGIFPSRYLHLGGDEASGKHWKTCPRCQGMTQAMAMQRVNDIVQSLGRKMVCWDEVFTDGLRDTTVAIMVWRDPETARLAREAGHEVVLAPARYCYLDKYQDAPFSQPRAMGGYLPVDSVYAHLYNIACGCEFSIFNFQSSNSLALCLWTEYVPTPEDAERMLWPRVLALAETLKPEPRSLEDFHQWAEQECRNLRARGISAYDLDREVGQRPEYIHQTTHLARGCRVTYTNPYHPYYPASGNQALTDGWQGGWSNTDGRWQGFLGSIDVTIDLGRRQRLQTIDVSFLQSRGVEIFFPSHIVVSMSDDLRYWKTLTDQPQFPDMQPDVLRTFTWQTSKQEGLSSVRARYVRLQAEPDSLGGWLFIDEIIIR